jgi:hypothetical protein
LLSKILLVGVTPIKREKETIKREKKKDKNRNTPIKREKERKNTRICA